MNPITVVVVAGKDAEELRYTLESLVAQSSENFDVIIVCGSSPEDVKTVAREYADEYVGFTVVECEKDSIPFCRNFAAKHAKTEYLLFVDAGDYLAPENTEKLGEAVAEKKPDIVTTRYYISGEGEPYYEHWNDLLATVPDIDRFDRALFNSLETEGRMFKKKFFDLYEEGYPDVPAFYNTAFLTKCIFDYGASVSGCAGAVYDRRNGVFRCGFPENGGPEKENLEYFNSLSERILADAADIIKETTGTFDGDEYAYQELLFVAFGFVTDRFYRYFWLFDDEMLGTIKQTLERLTDRMTADRKKKISEEYKDLRFPAMYMTHEDAVKMPMFSLIADFSADERLVPLLDSLYISRFPFFELFLRESAREITPEKYAVMPNIHFLPEGGFFTEARAEAEGVPINIKDPSPLDPRTLSELSVSKAPSGLLQYMFGLKRKQYATKTYLKKKGLNMR